MNKIIIVFSFAMLWANIIFAQSIDDYSIKWNTQSKNSSESMPVGGGDIGANVWVENGDVLFYFSRSGTFDENNTLLKLGRMRIRLTPNPFEREHFEQKLILKDGYVSIHGSDKEHSADIRIWVDVFNPIVNVDVSSNKNVSVEAFYETWRHEDRPLRKSESNQNSYKWAAPKDLSTKKDDIVFEGNKILFYHQNKDITVFDITVKQQGLEEYKDQIFNPLQDLIFGGIVESPQLRYSTVSDGIYEGTDYKAWKLESDKPLKKANVRIKLHTEKNESVAEWKSNLNKIQSSSSKETVTWWNEYWKRSWIHIDSKDKTSKGFEIARNYQLFRYMLGCNTYGEYPTKFNGGLFTYDPHHTDTLYNFTPDFRKWGGGTHTAQNQRLVYFPMLKSGDFEMMTPQFHFYNRLLPVAELRSKVYWNHDGASFTEQIENFGLPNPSEYGWKRPEEYDKGMEYNAWLEYQWDTALEFCLMILERETYTGQDISEYVPLIESVLKFFDEHYQHLARERGRRLLDGEGKLVLYPGSACETYKMAYNAVSTISGLKVVSQRLLESKSIASDTVKIKYLEEFISKIPENRTREIDGHTTIAPAWLWERINNVETPQLYPVFPWGTHGVGKANLDIAINTWKYDPDVTKFRSHVGWKQDAIWAAKLGLIDEAKDLVYKKLQSAETRFPTFWGPGFDWTPDHNWGGSGMIALQEMLLQVDDKRIMLLPTWDKQNDIHFKLHAPYNTTVECKVEGGKIVLLNILPKSREKDVINMLR